MEVPSKLLCLTKKARSLFGREIFRGVIGIFLTHAGLVLDKDNLRLTSMSPADLNVAIYPAPVSLDMSTEAISPAKPRVSLNALPPRLRAAIKLKAAFELLKPAGPPREITLGKIRAAGGDGSAGCRL